MIMKESRKFEPFRWLLLLMDMILNPFDWTMTGLDKDKIKEKYLGSEKLV